MSYDDALRATQEFSKAKKAIKGAVARCFIAPEFISIEGTNKQVAMDFIELHRMERLIIEDSN